MKDSSNPRFMVDFLVRDSDLYFIAFRQHLFLTEEEEEEARLLEKEEDGASSLPKKKKKGRRRRVVWALGITSRTRIILPKYIHSQPCIFILSHAGIVWLIRGKYYPFFHFYVLSLRDFQSFTMLLLG
jgi:hypothetical protein